VYQPRGGTYVETVRRNLAAEPTSLHRVLKWVDRRLNRRQRFLMLLERDLLSGTRPPVVAALSAYVKRQVVEQYPAAAAETHVVFNGVGVAPPDRDQSDRARGALRAMLGVPETTRVALFVAHNFKLKGLRELLRAWRWVQREAPANDVALLIVGNGKRQTYERQARALGVDRAIHFLSGQTEMPALYAGADILVHPTWYDPCSRVVLEALSYGLPTVTTRWNGAAEWLDEPAQGAVIDSPADQRALAAAVLRCLAAETRTTAQAAAEAFRERASMRRHAEELVALYEHVCAKRRGR
jgi:UDP-glucose:(heptosyl)LPS alpha-1,3-glucosyltransferase